jgi:hypothetical protein
MQASPPTILRQRKRRNAAVVFIPPAIDSDTYNYRTKRFDGAARSSCVRPEAPFPSGLEIEEASEEIESELDSAEEISDALQHIHDLLYKMQAERSCGKYWGGQHSNPGSAVSPLNVHLYVNPARHAYYSSMFEIVDALNEDFKSLLSNNLRRDYERTKALWSVEQARDKLVAQLITETFIGVPAGPEVQPECCCSDCEETHAPHSTPSKPAH